MLPFSEISAFLWLVCHLFLRDIAIHSYSQLYPIIMIYYLACPFCILLIIHSSFSQFSSSAILIAYPAKNLYSSLMVISNFDFSIDF